MPSVLVTGAATAIGFRLLKVLDKHSPVPVVGVYTEKPPIPLKRAEYIPADIRDPAFVEILRSAEVGTLCLLHFQAGMQAREADFERNVVGTIQALGAALEAGVRKIVVMSSTLIYGAYPNQPAFLAEDDPRRTESQVGYLHDAREMDQAVLSFLPQAPDTIITVLRFPWIVGSLRTPLTEYLNLPAVPVLLGFDPLWQLIHVDDVIGAVVQAMVVDLPGACNVAPDPVMPLLKVLAQVRKLPAPIPHPLAYASAGLVNSLASPLGLAMPIPPDYLRYSLVADTRRMRTELNYEPRYSADQTLEKLLEARRFGKLPFHDARSYTEDEIRERIQERLSGQMEAVSERGTE